MVRGFPSILRPFKDNYDKNQHIGCIAGEKQDCSKNRGVSGDFTSSSQEHAQELTSLVTVNPRAQSFLEVLKRFLVSPSDLFVENNSICQRRRQTYKLSASFPGRGRPWKRGWRLNFWKWQLDIIEKKLWIAARTDWSTSSERIEGDFYVVIVGLNDIARTSCFYNFKN